MTDERTQIFRGDEAPEMGVAESGGPKKAKKAKGPSDQRALSDQKDGHSELRSTHDAEGLSDQRSSHDAKGDSISQRMNDADGLSDQRRSHDGDGASDQRSMRDADGLSDARHAHDGDGPSDQRNMRDADGLSDGRHLQDADGLSDQRNMKDAEGDSDLRHMQDADGLSDLRQLHDHNADIPPAELKIGNITLDKLVGEKEEASEAEHVAAAETEPDEPAVPAEPEMSFKAAEEEAAPWAISIHLEARIQNLSTFTAKVSEQLDGLEAATKKLGKRIGR